LPPRQLDGPRRPPASGQARALAVLVHGYGADGNDLIALGQALSPVLPDVAFAAPHGPEPLPGSPTGRQWFGLTNLDPHELQAGAARAAPDLQNFIDRELNRLGVPPNKLVLIGFSQGTMMALAVGLWRSPSPAAILGYSGALVAPPQAQNPPPVFLVHGDEDPVLPFQASFAAFQALGAAGVPTLLHTRPGLGHGIDEPGLAWGAHFIASAIAGEFAGTGRPQPLPGANPHNIA
jgi:phospholipase/carboxylesterase